MDEEVAMKVPPLEEPSGKGGQSRITKEQKAEQKKKGRAIYVALGKNVKDRAPTHDKLSKHLAELKLEGAQRIKTSGTSYYALVFDMVHNFGEVTEKPEMVWSVAACPLATTVGVQLAAVAALAVVVVLVAREEESRDMAVYNLLMEQLLC
ncbi:hypothetical protein FPQ18DRAFT_394675 [Pyronema domesticum]|nr:hypothetical protein FPQ18DRAFT_394675 [Pyronema domesticum]